MSPLPDVVGGGVMSVGLPTGIDVDQSLDGEGEGVDEVVGDLLGDLVTLQDCEIGVDCCDESDEHAVPAPTHADIAHGGHTWDRVGNLLGPVDQGGINGIEDPPEHSGPGVPEQHQNHSGHDQACGWVDPIGTQSGPDTGGNHGERGQSIGPGVLAVGDEGFRRDAAPHTYPVLGDQLVARSADEPGGDDPWNVIE